MRVLIVEDQASPAGIVAEGLRDEGISADVACDRDKGALLASAYAYDVIVVDRDAPALGDEQVRRELARGSARILLVAAAGSVPGPTGADAYLSKPFTYPELIAQVRALGPGGGRRVVW
ncbi:hypothetical protein Misp01_26510 [Microtetraspora sp. NBRC 13810]|uniref:response regulator transcription factor n=1 Tax=Microtetraspora sp. NBRC 13810 TaxID=3030990 RepID=UPI0024A515E2|nr:hypothetical protein [Microtetraspora sp. NBRC 13810]GLW07521.1 hypothetical protein Misp01_26510 [Microtetraspora sp. NBRC 13810]